MRSCSLNRIARILALAEPPTPGRERSIARNIKMGLNILNFVLGVLGSLVAAAMFPRIATALGAMLALWFGWLPFGRSRDVAGVWKVAWHVESPRYAPVEVDEAVTVRQFRKRMYAKFRAGRIDCYVSGEIDGGRYVTGRWYDATEGGYHGVFQLIIDPDTSEMLGLRIGFSMSGIVKSGRFEWTRVVTP
jgi:hypothetical protein